VAAGSPWTLGGIVKDEKARFLVVCIRPMHLFETMWKDSWNDRHARKNLFVHPRG